MLTRDFVNKLLRDELINYDECHTLLKCIDICEKDASIRSILDSEIDSFYKKMRNPKFSFTREDILEFNDAIGLASVATQRVIYTAMSKVCMKLLKGAADEIQNLRAQLKKGLKPQIKPEHSKIYKRLLIFYSLYKDQPVRQLLQKEWDKVYFALNTLNLAGALDGIDISPLEADLTKLFNPGGSLIPSKQGIKPASRFVPIDESGKRSSRTDCTYLAVDTVKGGTFFVQTRDSSEKALQVLASKIARSQYKAFCIRPFFNEWPYCFKSIAWLSSTTDNKR